MFYISMYYGNQCRELYLAQEGTWNHAMTIAQESSGFSHDIVMPLRALEGKCFISAPSGMQWEGHGNEREISLTNNQKLRLTGGRVNIIILVFEIEKDSTIMSKYLLPLNMPVRIGRNEDCAISQDSDIMTSVHGEIFAVSKHECYYTDTSKNGSFINGIRISKQKAKLVYGDVITAGFGLKIIYMGDLLAINHPQTLRHNHLQKAAPPPSVQYNIKDVIEKDKTSAVIWYHRSPRIMNLENSEEVTIEPPLARDNTNLPPMWMTVGPSATMVVPMLLSAMVGGRGNVAPMLAMMGGSAAMAVMWGIINNNYRRKHGAEMESKRNEVYRQYISDMENRLLSLTEQEQARLNEQCLTVEQCLTLPSSNTHRLWERMPKHTDFTILRLGTGRVRLPNPIQIQEERLQLEPDPLGKEPARLKEAYEYMDEAPITVRLREWQIVGILDSMDHPDVMQSLVAQLAATHSYHDVLISILTQPNFRSQWDWARWLPHIYANEDRTMRLTAFTPNAVQAVMDHLSDVLMIREERMGEPSKKEDEEEAQPLPHYVIFCTDPTLMENQPLMRRIMSRRLGFTLVMLAESMEQLPKECDIIVQASDRLGAVYNAQGEITNVQYEVTDLHSLQRFSHQIAPLRVKDAMESTFIPSLVTFMEIYHARSVEDIDIWRFWNENHAYEGLRSTIGLRSGAQPFVLDISERYHGPHGLVAGTTGSGKSVMLQTYILSLSLNYHPEEVQFILIDYKGGGMANVFKTLPHVAGIIDNLQGQRTISRALLSIQGEIKRREEIFKRLGVEKIDEYIRYYNHDPNERPLAHLIIVVDEFAELKKEQPEFMRELVSTARVGRSVGLHMILATQKPSNSVDDEIWSNTNFRICLRVATRADSNDMLKRPDAAYLKGMGRCYVQVGNDEIFEQVQTSFSGAEYAPLALIGDEVPCMLDDAGRPMKVRKASNKNSSNKPKTQMDIVLERIGQIMEEHHLKPAQRLWMNEVEPVILLEDLPQFQDRCFDGQGWRTSDDFSSEFRVYFGIVDDVRMQRHLPLYTDFYKDHNIRILAPSGMGKTTLIQTMALSAAMTYTPEQVNMYIFSLTSRTLGALAYLPHVGEVVFENEDAEIVQLLNLIIDESNSRAKLFSQRMTDSFTQYNMAASMSGGAFKPLPAVLVFVDRFKQLMEKLDETKLRQLYDLVRNAAGRGIFFVVTAIALSSEEMGRVSNYFTGLAIQQEDRSAYKEAIGATGIITADEADVRPYPGRGLVWFDNGMHGAAACEMQCAIYASQVDAERAACVEQLARQMSAAWKGAVPRGIIRIPETLTSSGFIEILDKMDVKPQAGMLPIGLNKESGAPCIISMDETPSFLISGGVRSGRTETILALANMLEKTGAEVHLFGEDAALPRYAQAHSEAVRFHPLDDANLLVKYFTDELNPVMTQRKQAILLAENEGPEALRRFTQSQKPIVLMFDDYDLFAKAMYGQNAILDWMQKINRVMAGRRLHFILSMSHRAVGRSAANEFVQDVSKGGVGIALCGMLSEADPWGVGNANNRKLKYPIGEGLFIQNGQLAHVVLPEYE